MASRLHYHEQTGQVYTKTTVPVTSMVPTWMHKSTGVIKDPKNYHHKGAGAPSLYEMALRSCAWNMALFSPEALQYAEWPYAGKIYDYLKRRKALTAHGWSLFQQAFPTIEELDHEYCMIIPGNALNRLDSVHDWISSLPFSHLSFLNLSTVTVHRDDLMRLIGIPSLAALILTLSPFLGAVHLTWSDVDDKFMRDWGRAVEEKGGFTKLKTLVINDTGATVAGTLRGVAAFPALCLCRLPSFDRVPNQAQSGAVDHSPWRPAPQEAPMDPELIWSHRRSDHEGMKALYELACTFSTSTPDANSHTAVFSVQYGMRSHYRRADHLWFIRENMLNEESVDIVERKKKNGIIRGLQEEDSRKKRKIRADKQKDIGSLLGTFG